MMRTIKQISSQKRVSSIPVSQVCQKRTKFMRPMKTCWKLQVNLKKKSQLIPVALTLFSSDELWAHSKLNHGNR
jgi:hypothetical protein